mmetsp:Transcript_7631/g.16619  ORF Transcript_7631/g.16619 Transcript_7631/m.16619 type:complete len:98 (+) Transcript_7631:142-435(+)
MKLGEFAVGGEEAGFDDGEAMGARYVIVAKIGEGWDGGGGRVSGGGTHSNDGYTRSGFDCYGSDATARVGSDYGRCCSDDGHSVIIKISGDSPNLYP